MLATKPPLDVASATGFSAISRRTLTPPRAVGAPQPGDPARPRHTWGTNAAPTSVARRHAVQSLVFVVAGAGMGLLLEVAPARATALQDAARTFVRGEDISPEQAAVAFLDARSTLREIAALAATAPDSRERFEARREWPGYAKWLRRVGPAAPVLVGLVLGQDSEATLGEEYGGRAGASGPADAVYVSLGKILTISGRTIKEEAQFDPSLAAGAVEAINTFLAQVPKEVVDHAQEVRIARAGGKP